MDMHDRLYNWARWSRHDALPNLDVKQPSIFAMFLPRLALDSGYGDYGPPSEYPTSIDTRDAELVDRHIGWLTMSHRSIIKLHYIEHHGQERLRLDEACRALEDLMR